jgi:anti-anti-sigma factor
VYELPSRSCQRPAAFGRFPHIVDFDEQAATLRCCGDEDRSTQGVRRRAITRAIQARRDVVVDLSELAFADSSLMVDLAVLARRLRACDAAMALREPQPQILRLIKLVGLHRLPGVRLDGPAPAIA